jgi:hypothetical protein
MDWQAEAAMLTLFQRLQDMRIRSIVAPLLFAALVTVIPVSGYAFNLAQILGRGEEQDLNTFKLIHVADLKALVAKHGDKVHVYDANAAATRDRFGIIPGSTLLSSDDNYPLSVLPPNKHATLVFYCADTH